MRQNEEREKVKKEEVDNQLYLSLSASDVNTSQYAAIISGQVNKILEDFNEFDIKRALEESQHVEQSNSEMDTENNTENTKPSNRHSPLFGKSVEYELKPSPQDVVDNEEERNIDVAAKLVNKMISQGNGNEYATSKYTPKADAIQFFKHKLKVILTLPPLDLTVLLCSQQHNICKCTRKGNIGKSFKLKLDI